MPHPNNKQNKNKNPIISRQDYHLTQPCPSEEKQTNKISAQISPYKKITNSTGPTLKWKWKWSRSVMSDSYQAPSSMGFPRQEYWSGLPFPSPGVLPNPGIEPGSPALWADALTSEPPGNLRRAENKRKKEFNLEAWEKETSNTVS